MGQTSCLGASMSDTTAPRPVRESELRPRNVVLGHNMALDFKERIINGQLAPFYAPTDNEKDEECPICCNNFTDFNWFTCCNHPICSECFVQLWQTSHNERARYAGVQCPFCKRDNGHLHLRFRKLSSQEKAKRRKDEEESREAQRRAQLRDKEDLGCFLPPPTPSPLCTRNTYSPPSPRMGGRVGLPTLSPTSVRSSYPAHARHPQPLHASAAHSVAAPRRPAPWQVPSRRSEFPGFPTFEPTFSAILEQNSTHENAPRRRAPPAPPSPAAHQMYTHAGLDTIEEQELLARVRVLRDLTSQSMDDFNDYACQMYVTMRNQQERRRRFMGQEAESTSEFNSESSPVDTPIASSSAMSPMRSDTTMVTPDESPTPEVANANNPQNNPNNSRIINANNVATSAASGLDATGGGGGAAVTTSPLQFAYELSPSESMRDAHAEDELSPPERASVMQRFLTLGRRRNSNPFGTAGVAEDSSSAQNSQNSGQVDNTHAAHAHAFAPDAPTHRFAFRSPQATQRRAGLLVSSSPREFLVPHFTNTPGTTRETPTTPTTTPDPVPPAAIQNRPTPPLPTVTEEARNACTFYSRHPQAPVPTPVVGLVGGSPTRAAATADTPSTPPNRGRRTQATTVTTSPANPPSPQTPMQTPTSPGLPPLPPRPTPPRSQTHAVTMHARSSPPPRRAQANTTTSNTNASPSAQNIAPSAMNNARDGARRHLESAYMSFENLNNLRSNSQSNTLSPFSLYDDDAYNAYIGAPRSFYSPPRNISGYYPPQSTWNFERDAHGEDAAPLRYPRSAGSASPPSMRARNVAEDETSASSSPRTPRIVEQQEANIRALLAACDGDSSPDSSIIMDLHEALEQAAQYRPQQHQHRSEQEPTHDDEQPPRLSESLISEFRGPNGPPFSARDTPHRNARSTPLPSTPSHPRPFVPHDYRMHLRALPTPEQRSGREFGDLDPDSNVMWVNGGPACIQRMRRFLATEDAWRDLSTDADAYSPFMSFSPRESTQNSISSSAVQENLGLLRRMHEAVQESDQQNRARPRNSSTQNARNTHNPRFDHIAPASATEEQAMLEAALQLSREEGGDSPNTPTTPETFAPNPMEHRLANSMHAVHASGCNAIPGPTSPRVFEWLEQVQESASEPLADHGTAVGLPILGDSGTFQRSLSQVPEHSQEHSAMSREPSPPTFTCTPAYARRSDTFVGEHVGELEFTQGTQDCPEQRETNSDASSPGIGRQGTRTSPFSGLHWPTWSFGRRARDMNFVARRGDRQRDNTGDQDSSQAGFRGDDVDRDRGLLSRPAALLRSGAMQRQRRQLMMSATGARRITGRRPTVENRGNGSRLPDRLRAAADRRQEAERRVAGVSAAASVPLELQWVQRRRRRRSCMSSPSAAGSTARAQRAQRLASPRVSPRSGNVPSSERSSGASRRSGSAAGAAAAGARRRYAATSQERRRAAGASRAHLMTRLGENDSSNSLSIQAASDLCLDS